MDNQELSEYYKTISNAELLAILNNAGDYREEAIEAAKKEFTQRRIHETEMIYKKKNSIKLNRK
jgi:GTPase involved in cell partitioning and DNA repair